MKRKLLALLTILVLVGMLPGVALASPVASGGVDDDAALVQKEDNRPDPLTTKQLELKEQALAAKLNGKAYGKTHEVARGQYVELAREGEDPIWTVLGEFPDLEHNMIPEPDRTVNNTTLWVPDFSRDWIYNMLFDDTPGANSMRNFYIEQSSGRYAVHGDVTDWAMVSQGYAHYNDDLDCATGNCVWEFLDETVDVWYARQIAAGKTPAQINEYLKGFDVWDRYDYDRRRQL